MSEPKHRKIGLDHRGSYWYFPELEGPDLSSEVVPGQHDALALLGKFTISEIFSDDPETESRIFGPATSE